MGCHNVCLVYGKILKNIPNSSLDTPFYFIISNVASSPEPKAPGELIVWEASVVRPHFQTTSPLKPLGQM